MYLVFVEYLLSFIATGPFAARVVDQLPMSSSGNPGGGIFGNTLCWPADNGGGKRILHGLFRQIERAGNADQAGYDASGLIPKHRFDYVAEIAGHGIERGVSRIGRISTQPAPPRQEVEIFAAQLSASSRSWQSRM